MMRDKILRALNNPREIANAQLATVAKRERDGQPRRIPERSCVRGEQARFALGRAYLEAGLADQAINELRKAVRLEPQNEAARRLLQKALSQRAADRR